MGRGGASGGGGSEEDRNWNRPEEDSIGLALRFANKYTEIPSSLQLPAKSYRVLIRCDSSAQLTRPDAGFVVVVRSQRLKLSCLSTKRSC
jgi:hypothetical protein